MLDIKQGNSRCSRDVVYQKNDEDIKDEKKSNELVLKEANLGRSLIKTIGRRRRQLRPSVKAGLAVDGARTRNRRIPTYLRVGTLFTATPTKGKASNTGGLDFDYRLLAADNRSSSSSSSLGAFSGTDIGDHVPPLKPILSQPHKAVVASLTYCP
ncbi:hypothetical protein PoB_006537400 [Plakobranchus ocellatus]|uniref:Uncharacterized protein n=1 Tax=Plakobranchus ocellatus TaxID=259542 RepID=A0AAV4D3Z8_9GAST|nr:hypothetical protein PoB_006537400 [Plakobranchus ocellatus]